MITQALCDVFYWIAGFFIGILPQFPSFDGLYINLQPLLTALLQINTFVDLKVLQTCLLIILVVYNIKFLWSIVMWIVRKIPGVS